MSQIPRVQNPNTTPKVSSVGTIRNEGPSAGFMPPANLDTYETISGNFALYYKGGKIGTAYELVKIDGKNIVKEVAGYAVAMVKAAKDDKIELKITSGLL